MRVRRIVSLIAVPFVLAATLAALWLVRVPNVRATLYELIGREAERIPAFLREASSSEVAIIVSSPVAAEAEETARKLATSLKISSQEIPSGAVDFIRENRSGLVTRETAELLKTADGRARLAKRAVRRLYLSPVPPVLGFEDDPFCLTDSFLLSLSGGATRSSSGEARTPPLRRCISAERSELREAKWLQRCVPPHHHDDFATTSVLTNGVTRILLKTRLETTDLEATSAALDGLRRAADECRSPETEVRFAGAPVHAALSAAKSKSEIGALTAFSLVFIAVLSLVVFRSWKWIPLLASSLVVSALAGGIALVALFRDIHVMTFVLGTTVLGLVIDYSFHWLLSPAHDKPAVRRNLLISFLTTEISLVPLMLTTIPVLRQSAIFLGVGLAAALAYVLACYPKGGERGPRRVRTLPALPNGRGIALLFLLAVLISCVGICRLRIRTDITSLYRPPAELLEAERQRASFGEFDFSSIPAPGERRAIAANVATLYAEHGAEMAKSLGLKSLVPPPAPTFDLMRPQELMETIFGVWTTDALRRLGLSVFALVVVLTILCRRRVLSILLPPLLALMSVAGFLGWRGIPLNLFHLLAMFLLLGMGIDYAVFLKSGNRSALLPALSSLLTSMAGFGALAFVSFPVVASFGIVLGLGLPTAFVLSLVRGRDRPVVSTHERAASPLGLEVLWLVYRIFGLHILHFLAGMVGSCVWACSSSVRQASPSARKVANFACSLADKLVVMAEGTRLPKVETDATDDAEAFLSDVRKGKGVFILSSHVGTIEVLTALGECERTFHAWMDFDRTGVFNRFYLRHARRQRVVIHPISSFGMETVFEAGDLIDAGDCLVMAGDRGDGAFRFAAAFDHPVYFVACVAEGSCRYRAVIRRLPSDRKEMKAAYVEMLEKIVRDYPDQHFAWRT